MKRKKVNEARPLPHVRALHPAIPMQVAGEKAQERCTNLLHRTLFDTCSHQPWFVDDWYETFYMLRGHTPGTCETLVPCDIKYVAENFTIKPLSRDANNGTPSPYEVWCEHVSGL